MKLTKLLALCLAIAMMVGMTACTKRGTGSGMSSSSSSLPSSSSEVSPSSMPSEPDEDDKDNEDEDENDLDSSQSDSDTEPDDPADPSEPVDPDDEDSVSESITSAMSTGFSEIGALSKEKKGWGSGGPTDSEKRPDGARLFQGTYGKYDARFIGPDTKTIYLTFDEGYENGYTGQILDTLKEKNVKAVFFVTYPYARDQPELITRMIKEGHTIGNHSTKHLNFAEMKLEDAAADIMNLHEYMKVTYGYTMWLFRPPEGVFNEQSLALAQSLGYKSVFWSFAYKDWLVDQQPVNIEALGNMVEKCHPGAIYLLHAVSRTNMEVLDDMIDQVRDNGFTFATEFFFS